MSAFEHICQGGQASLVQAALEFSCDAYPALRVPHYLRKLERITAQLMTRIDVGAAPVDILSTINEFYFEELEFSGNTEDYYDPRNSYLNDVLDRKVGIPISLGVIYQHLAASAGVRLKGVNFPGHFLLRYDRDPGHVYIDVFHGGRQLTFEDCQERLRDTLGEQSDLGERHLPPMTQKEILLRMLRNLKGIYSRSDFERCLQIQERIVQLCPTALEEIRDLGILYFHVGKPLRAVRTLEQLVQKFPQMPQKEVIASYIHKAAREAVLLN